MVKGKTEVKGYTNDNDDDRKAVLKKLSALHK